MKKLPCLAFAFILSACNVEPEALHYGEDACHTCRMTLVDRKFGAELVTRKGKIYKFDDLNCMLAFYNSGEVDTGDYAYKLVVDLSQPGKFIDAADAFYVKAPSIKTPMASHVAAFADKESMETANTQLKGIYLVWGELVTQFK